MTGKKKELSVFEKIEILNAGSEGKAIARVDNMVIFVPFVVPGDIVDIIVTKKKKSFFEGKAVKFHKYSEKRTEPKCEHFGLCGGCKWQNMAYSEQLYYKQNQVKDNFERIGKLDIPEILPIIPAKQQYFYRNKLEFTFLNRKWLIDGKKPSEKPVNMDGLGFHLLGMYDRIIDLKNCYLQKEPSNTIRLALRDYALKNALEFYDIKKHNGFLRNVIIRNTKNGEVMVIMVFASDKREEITGLMDFLWDSFPEINSLFWVINDKKNDTISDLPVNLYRGKSFIMEEMEGVKFKISPLTFFQTNPEQAYELYKTARNFADFCGNETVYDLYCGAGSISNFISKYVTKVVGIEYIPSAIIDARENSEINNIANTVFYTGDIAKIMDDNFVYKNGIPDVIITDPPRAGMSPKVVKQIIKILPQKIVYISCNPATQARDIALLTDYYSIKKICPVDMFPQTHHVENVCLLVRKLESRK